MSKTSFAEYFCYRRKFLLYNLISRNLKVRYRHSLLGMFWTVLIPAVTAAIFYVIFNYVFKVQIPHYLLFLLSGLIPWTFFSTAVPLGTESLVNNYNLLNKVPIPIHALLYAEALTHLLNLLLSIPVLIAAMVIFRVWPTWTMIQYPLLVGFLFLITYSFCIIFGLVYVYFRDLKHIITLLLQLWMYGTPVMYSSEMIPQRFRWVLAVNPVGTIFVGFHESLVGNKWLTSQEYLTIAAWVLFLLFLSKYMLNKMRDSIVEML